VASMQSPGKRAWWWRLLLAYLLLSAVAIVIAFLMLKAAKSFHAVALAPFAPFGEARRVSSAIKTTSSVV
jgi:hypothetical protein